MTGKLPSFFLLAAGAIIACETVPSAVCDDVGACQTWSSDQIASCQASGLALTHEAADAGCGAKLDAYYECAASAYDCQGNTPVFAGCERAKSDAQACLDGARAQGPCGALAAALAACGGSPPDASPSPCAGGGPCAARCYLDSVADVCHPKPAQLTAFSTCAGACPL